MNPIHYIKSGSFPIIVAFSGGKDSIAMVLHLLEQGIDRHRIHLHHHDVDGAGVPLFDWACTASYCRAFAHAFGLSLYFSYREGGILREILRQDEPRQDVYFQKVPGGPFHCIPAKKSARNTRLKFPAVSADLRTRWCSSTVKIDVFNTVIRHHETYRREIMVVTGERAEESTARSKYQPQETHSTNTLFRKATHWRPVLHWSEAEIWAILQRWRVQPHPAYMLGWNRCSCQLCIFNSPNLWATIHKLSPEKVERIAIVEQFTGFTLYNRQTIYQRIAFGEPLQNLSAYWVAQATGAFTNPILIDEWTLPPGAFSREPAGSV
ncbi:phosphoadenosine phosphosulfate reductase family protein [Puia sp. P3]|uniref:phosphoadenosine phosphosulfate reductase domain-containing protein n=1 Tax=Puia sp. P3 TaxID=3423952 RepID=UPI003D67BCBB